MARSQAKTAKTGKKIGIAPPLQGLSDKEMRDLGETALYLGAYRWIEREGDRGAEGCRAGLYPLFSQRFDGIDGATTEVRTPVATLRGQRFTEYTLDVNRFLLTYGERLPPDLRRLAKTMAFRRVGVTPVLDGAVKRQLKKAYPTEKRRKKGQISLWEQAGIPRWEWEYNLLVVRSPQTRIYVEGEPEEARTAGRFKVLYGLLVHESQRTEAELKGTTQTAQTDKQYADRLQERLRFYETLKKQIAPYAETGL
ncbi:MAG: hypothetical protein HYU56_03065 [Candidatus Aenigmarchaeota archaeon]|nr:hypothetical protein [Candidatus Aenigmarchaeota archaeon]